MIDGNSTPRSLFGAHVTECADQITRLRNPNIGDDMCQPKIGHPDRPLEVEQQICRFDIAVNDPRFMGIIQCIGDLCCEQGGGTKGLSSLCRSRGDLHVRGGDGRGRGVRGRCHHRPGTGNGEIITAQFLNQTSE